MLKKHKLHWMLAIGLLILAIALILVLCMKRSYEKEDFLGRSYQDIVDEYGEFYMVKPETFKGSGISYYGVMDVTGKLDFESWYIVISFDENDIAIDVSEKSQSF